MAISKNGAPTWSEIKAKLADFDRAGLIGLVQSLYAASKDNQVFLHARFGLGDDPLQPYKATISKWINPADPRKPLSVAKARKAIGDYKKALGHPEGLAELAVFYCEEVFAFLEICGIDDAGFFDALVRMFEQALKTTALLPEERRPELMARLDAVRRLGHNLGYGVGDDMDDLLAEHGFDGGPC